jgi:hypothetical protein
MVLRFEDQINVLHPLVGVNNKINMVFPWAVRSGFLRSWDSDECDAQSV